MTTARAELLQARNGPMGRRCALALLIALATGLAAGLLVWGPVHLDEGDHHYADLRSWGGLSHALNVLSCGPLFLAACWGALATHRSLWGAEVRRPWVGFHAFAALAAAASGIYHAAPSDTGFLVAHGLTSGAFVMLMFGVLAERVHPDFGSWRGLAVAVLILLLAAAAVGAGHFRW